MITEASQLAPAPIYKRFLASACDVFLFAIVLAYILQAGVEISSYNEMGWSSPHTEMSKSFVASMILGALISVGIIGTQIILISRHAQSIGKRLMKLYVVRAGSELPCDVGRYVGLRTMPVMVVPLFLMVISFDMLAAIVLSLDMLLILGTQRQCMHDMLADTLVLGRT